MDPRERTSQKESVWYQTLLTMNWTRRLYRSRDSSANAIAGPCVAPLISLSLLCPLLSGLHILYPTLHISPLRNTLYSCEFLPTRFMLLQNLRLPPPLHHFYFTSEFLSDPFSYSFNHWSNGINLPILSVFPNSKAWLQLMISVWGRVTGFSAYGLGTLMTDAICNTNGVRWWQMKESPLYNWTSIYAIPDWSTFLKRKYTSGNFLWTGIVIK